MLIGSGARLCALGVDGEVLKSVGCPLHVSPKEVGASADSFCRPLCLSFKLVVGACVGVVPLFFGLDWGGLALSAAALAIHSIQQVYRPEVVAHKRSFCTCHLPAQASTQGLVKELEARGEARGARVLCPVPHVTGGLVGMHASRMYATDSHVAMPLHAPAVLLK